MVSKKSMSGLIRGQESTPSSITRAGMWKLWVVVALGPYGVVKWSEPSKGVQIVRAIRVQLTQTIKRGVAIELQDALFSQPGVHADPTDPVQPGQGEQILPPKALYVLEVR